MVGTAIFFAMILFGLPASAATSNNAALVHLRYDDPNKPDDGCAGIPDNCFSNIDDVYTWIKTIRKPNASAPLIVQIGPGTFFKEAGILTCGPTGVTGYVSFVGAGRQHTTIERDNGITLTFNGCEAIAFKDLTIRAFGGSGGAIQWNGGGSSTWDNVDINAQYYGWAEATCGPTRGKHYWFGSRILTTDFGSSAIGYQARCDESWFFGSQIQTTASGASNFPTVLNVLNKGEIHVYGSVIRALSDYPVSNNGTLTAVKTSENGKIHIHGTGIDVISSVPNNIMALSATGAGAEIHANESSYFLKTAGGTTTRISKLNGGHIHAPYLWEHLPATPFESVTGADMTTVAVTDASGTHPHLVIYDSTCLSKWFDTTDKACRP